MYKEIDSEKVIYEFISWKIDNFCRKFVFQRYLVVWVCSGMLEHIMITEPKFP